MLITEIRPLLSQTFDIVYHEFDALCRGNLPASRLLAYLFGLTEVLENNPKYAVREGWIYKSGRNLWEDLGGLQARGRARDYELAFDEADAVGQGLCAQREGCAGF